MNYKPLGTSDLRISEISFGCMSLGNDHAQNALLLHRALDEGITYFDTADIYQKGQNEITMGKAFADRRHNVIIATKVGNVWKADGSGLDWNPRRDHILKSVDESLSRLRTDYIDLYQLHGGTIDDPVDETIEAFELLKQQGKIRYYGLSSIRPNVIRDYVARSGIVSVMMQYSLLDRRPEETCLDLLYKNNIGVLARGSVAGGLLVDKPMKEYLDYSREEVEGAVSVLHNEAGEGSNFNTAVRFVLGNPAITSAVVGMRDEKQLNDSLRASRSTPLSVQQMAILKNAIKINTYRDHR